MMEVSRLRKLIKDNISELKVVMGGDDNKSKLVLIPRKEYSRYFGIDTIVKKELKDE